MNLSTLATKVLGPSWKTSLAGYAQLFAVTAFQGAQALLGHAIHGSDVAVVLVSATVAVVARFAADEGLKLPAIDDKAVAQKIVDEAISYLPKGAVAEIKK